MNVPRLTLALAATLAAAVVPAAAAPSAMRVMDVPAALRDQIDEVATANSVPVLLPSRMPVDQAGLVGQGGAVPGGYAFTIGAPGCGGAGACTIAEFSAETGRAPRGRVRVRLEGGRTGWFTPLRCGGSCADPTLEFKVGRVTYTFVAAIGRPGVNRTQLVRLANQALVAGNRLQR